VDTPLLEELLPWRSIGLTAYIGMSLSDPRASSREHQARAFRRGSSGTDSALDSAWPVASRLLSERDKKHGIFAEVADYRAMVDASTGDGPRAVVSYAERA